MSSILQRLGEAARHVFGGSEQRFVAHDFMQWYRDIGQPHSFKPEQSLKAYGDNPWLYAAVNAISYEVSRTDFFLEQKKGDDWIRVESHQAIATLKNPIPMAAGKSHLTKRQLFFLTGQKMLLNGEDFWLLDNRLKVNAAPTVIEPLLPGNVKTHFGKDNAISKYTYETGAGTIEVPPESIVHFKTMDPSDPFRGHSPTKSIRFPLDTHLEADILNLYRLKNNAIPSGILTSEQKIGDEDRKKYLAAWKQMFGGSKNSDKTAFLPAGIDFKVVQQTNAEMQFAESKERNRDEILANYRIGLEMLGKTESQTRANAEAAMFQFSRFVILPMLEMITDTLNNDYLSQFPVKGEMRFSFPDPVPENMEEKRATITSLSSFAALTPDEARRMMGLDPLNIAGVTDIPYMAFSNTPATSVLDEPEEPEEVEDEPPDEKEAPLGGQ